MPSCDASWPCSGRRSPAHAWARIPRNCTTCAVATRRLRAVLDLFAEVLPIRSRNFRGELGWLAGVLGAVRDLDVQLQAQAAMVEPGQEELWADLTALLTRERVPPASVLLTGLDSVRWERLVSGMAAMVQQGPLRRVTASRVAALVAVPDLGAPATPPWSRRRGRAKRSGEAADFHRLRIRCKRLRYSLEFGAELYDVCTDRYTRQLAKLQNQLGLMQDAEVAATRLADLATGDANLPASTIFVMGGVAELHRQEMARLLELLPAEVSRVRGREWLELTTTMDRGRDRALALIPPIRRTLRVLPDDSAPEPSGATTGAAASVPACWYGPIWPAPPAVATTRLESGHGERLGITDHQTGVLGEDELEPVGIEEALDVFPHVGEIRLRCVCVVAVHALEPLHRDPVVAPVVFAAVVRHRPRVLLVAQDVAPALERHDQRTMHVAPVLVELLGCESRLAPQKARKSDHRTPPLDDMLFSAHTVGQPRRRCPRAHRRGPASGPAPGTGGGNGGGSESRARWRPLRTR